MSEAHNALDAPLGFLHHQRIPMALDLGELAVSAHDGGARFSVHVKPRASRAKVLGTRETSLDVSVTAPPVEGEANAELVAMLAKRLAVPRRAVRVIAGEHGRQKLIEVLGLAPDVVRTRLGGEA